MNYEHDGQPGEPGQDGSSESGGAGGAGGRGGTGGHMGGQGGSGGSGGKYGNRRGFANQGASRFAKIERALGVVFQVIVVVVVIFSLFLFMRVQNTSQTAKQAATQAVQQAEQAQVKSGLRTCMALEQLSSASKGIDLSNPTTPDKQYLLNLNRALINVVNSTGCNKIDGGT